MSQATVTEDRVKLGIASMMVGVAAMTIMDAAAKWLGGNYSIIEIIFFRSLFALVPVSFIVWRGGGWRSLSVQKPLGHALRAALGLGAMFCFFTGLRFLPLADAVTIGFAAPLFVTALSVPVLGEHVGIRRWAAVAAGFVGVMIASQPGSGVFQVESFYIIGAALFYASAMLVTRRLTRSESTPAIVFYSTAIATVVAGSLLAFVWQAPTLDDLYVLAVMGLVGGGGGYFMTQAYRHAPAAVVAPFDYTALLWGVALGWLIWRELPGPSVWLGAAIVTASGIYIIHRETRVQQRTTG